jgi:hypothetical protein
MTKAEMLERMSSAELTEQMAYDEVLTAEREKQNRMADKGMRRR